MLQRTFLSLMLLVALVPRATGQQPQQRPTTEPPKPATAQPEADSQDVVKITTNLVQVDAVADQQSRLITLRLHNDTYQSALRNGIVYSLDTSLKLPGAFQFRIALRDQSSARIGSAGQFIQVPNVPDGRLALSGLILLKDIPEKSESPNANPQGAPDAISSGPAVRQFRQGDKLIFAYSVYNGQQDPATHFLQLTA